MLKTTLWVQLSLPSHDGNMPGMSATLVLCEHSHHSLHRSLLCTETVVVFILLHVKAEPTSHHSSTESKFMSYPGTATYFFNSTENTKETWTCNLLKYISSIASAFFSHATFILFFKDALCFLHAQRSNISTVIPFKLLPNRMEKCV